MGHLQKLSWLNLSLFLSLSTFRGHPCHVTDFLVHLFEEQACFNLLGGQILLDLHLLLGFPDFSLLENGLGVAHLDCKAVL